MFHLFFPEVPEAVDCSSREMAAHEMADKTRGSAGEASRGRMIYLFGEDSDMSEGKAPGACALVEPSACLPAAVPMSLGSPIQDTGRSEESLVRLRPLDDYPNQAAIAALRRHSHDPPDMRGFWSSRHQEF